jgi:hypothetical protein
MVSGQLSDWILGGTTILALVYAFLTHRRGIQKQQGDTETALEKVKESLRKTDERLGEVHESVASIIESSGCIRLILGDLDDRTKTLEVALRRSLARLETSRLTPKPTCPFVLPFESALAARGGSEFEMLRD